MRVTYNSYFLIFLYNYIRGFDNMRRRIHLKKQKKHKFGVGNTIIIILILIITMTFFSLNYLNKNVVPVLMSYASSQVRKLSNLIINRAISKQIAEDLNVEDMFIITKSESGEIRTIDFDPIVVNKTLNKIVNTIQLNLKYLEEGKLDLLELPDNVLIDYDEEKLSKGVIYEIPSGVIFKNSLLSNIGPKIPVKLSLVGDIVSNVNTKVTNYGINNALIEVSIYVQVESRVILPFITDTITVETDIPVAMKLVQGIVPDYLLGGLTNSSIPLTVPN